ncbi:MAG: rubrerythrin [Nitrospiraceae bacterium]|nr:rubrerythrin [Nitrospiraceae bacterium]
MFSAREVFDIALQVERNGAAFYRQAADSAEDGAMKELFQELAEMENDHVRTFIEMKDRLLTPGEKAWFDPDGEAAGYLQVIAGSRLFPVHASVSEILEGLPTTRDILTFALDRERESILFYTGMSKIMHGADDRERIDDIIGQEMQHVTLLTRKIEAL